MYRIIYIITRIINIARTYLLLRRNHVQHSTFHCLGVPFISNDGGSIVWGKDFAMINGMYGNQIGFNSPCIFRCEKAKIIIGDNVGISQSAIISKLADVNIGNNVKLGGGVKLYTSDFHSLNYEHRRKWMVDREHRHSAPISIEDDCFIGAGSIILKGVKIGARSIVGAGSVVTKSIPSDEIWAGNPAKFIRKLNENTHI